MGDQLRTPVAIAGGGTVGLALALFLDRHGISSTVFGAGEQGLRRPGGDTHSARTMEYYRSLGVADPIRRLGLPRDFPADVAHFVRYSRPELSRIALPGPTEALRRVAAAPRTDQVPEPVHRAARSRVEDFLSAHAGTRPHITLRPDWRITALEQDAERVRVHAEHPACPGEDWTARYAVGSDVSPAFVQQILGIRYEDVRAGTGAAARPSPAIAAGVAVARLRLPTFHREVLSGRPARSYWAVNAELVMNLTVLDGDEDFLLLTGAADPGAADPDRLADLVRRAAGTDLPVEVLGRGVWSSGGARVAERFVKGRVLLAGESAHRFAPHGGLALGLDNGIDDAANLAWKLAAVLRGWGGPDLLATYGGERRPVALRECAAARELSAGLARIERPAALYTDGPEGASIRDRVGDLLAGLGTRTQGVGVHLGARYDDSPIVVPDEDAVPPGDSPGMYLPTSIPGGRTPHLWLDDWHGPGSSLFDRLGPGYTLLRLGPEPPSGKPLLAAAQAQGMPLHVLDVDDPPARDLYERDLVLVRPDRHVAWRGNQLPTDPGDLVARVTGSGRLPPEGRP